MNNAIAIVTVIDQPIDCDGEPMLHLKKGSNHILFDNNNPNDPGALFYVLVNGIYPHYFDREFMDSHFSSVALTPDQVLQIRGQF